MKRLFALIAMMMLLSLAAGAVSAASLTIAGSTTVLPVAQAWAEEYGNQNPGMNLSVSGGGSGTGISMLLNGTCDIADASRPAKSKEIQKGRTKNKKLVATKVARDGIAIVVHPSNGVSELSMDQIKNIYLGKYTNWKQVGGSNLEIVTVGRDSSSGTYGFFRDLVLGGQKYYRGMLGQPSNAAVASTVKSTKGGIGYVGVAYADKGEKKGELKTVAVSSKAGKKAMKPTKQTVMSGDYPLFRFLYMYTLGSPSGEAKKFLNFGLSSEGQDLVTKVGYFPVK